MARGVVRGIALFAVASEFVNAQMTTSACNWVAPGVGTSFDLSGARLPKGQSYTVTDVRQPKTTYSFNVCDNVDPPNAAVCSQKLPCWNCIPRSAQPAAGWQMQGNGSICYRLGTTGGTNWTYQLQDVNYPNKGVTMVYSGGDNTYCPNNGMRSLWLQFLCHPTSSTPQKTLSTTVIGRNECNYGIGIPSIVGCPSECRTGATSLCSSNGVCGFNADKQRSQCYCYSGYSGSTCGAAVPPPPALTAEGIILIVVLIALAAVVGLVVFMFLKLRKLTVDPGAYDQLQGRFNELGMLA